MENEQLEHLTRDYVRAGWTVTSRTPTSVALEKGEQRALLRVGEDGAAQVDGPALPMVILDGRTRSWLLLLLILIAVFSIAWAVGFFR